MEIDDFTTTTQIAYKWPYPLRPVGRACKPPEPDDYVAHGRAVVPPYCGCSLHPHEKQLQRYMHLTGRQEEICQDYVQNLRDMAALTTEILEHPCGNMESKMISLTHLDYKVPDFPLMGYRDLVAADDAPTVPPPPYRPLKPCKPYKHSPAIWPCVKTPNEPTLGQTSVNVSAWLEGWPGRTEYEAGISASGLALWRGSQGFREPRPSARKRADDPFL